MEDGSTEEEKFLRQLQRWKKALNIAMGIFEDRFWLKSDCFEWSCLSTRLSQQQYSKYNDQITPLRRIINNSLFLNDKDIQICDYFKHLKQQEQLYRLEKIKKNHQAQDLQLQQMYPGLVPDKSILRGKIIHYFKKGHRQNPKNQPLLFILFEYTRNKDRKINYLRKLVRLNPLQFVHTAKLAYLLYENNYKWEALDVINKSIDLASRCNVDNRTKSSIYLLKGKLLIYKNHLDEAFEYFRQALKLKCSTQACKQIIDILIFLGRFELVQLFINIYKQQRPKSITFLAVQALCLLKACRVVEYHTIIIQIDKQCKDSHKRKQIYFQSYIRGVQSFYRLEYAECYSFLQLQLQSNQKSLAVNYMLGLCCHRLQKYRASQYYFQFIYRQNVLNVDIEFQKAVSQLNLQNFSVVQQLVRQLHFPLNITAFKSYSLLYQMLFNLGYYLTVINCPTPLTRWTSIFKIQANIIQMLCYKRLGNIIQMIKRYVQTIDMIASMYVSFNQFVLFQQILYLINFGFANSLTKNRLKLIEKANSVILIVKRVNRKKGEELETQLYERKIVDITLLIIGSF